MMKETKVIRILQIVWAIFCIIGIAGNFSQFEYLDLVIALAVLVFPIIFLERLKENSEKFNALNEASLQNPEKFKSSGENSMQRFEKNNAAAETFSQNSGEVQSVKWYKSSWAIILFLIFVPPLGIYLMFKNKKSWNPILKAFATVISVLIFIGMLNTNGNETSDKQPIDASSESVVTASITPASETTPTVKVKKTKTPEPTVEVTEAPTPEPTVEVTEAPTPEPTVEVTKAPTPEPTVEVTEAPTPEPVVAEQSQNEVAEQSYNTNEQAAAESNQTIEQSSSEDTELVWISDGGTKYHCKKTCSGMKNNVRQVTVDEAIRQGHKEPCKKCY